MERNIELNKNERIDDLQYKGLKIIQDGTGFCFGIDSVILSDFAKNIKNDATVVDLGTGTGIIGTLLCGKTYLKQVIGIEVQPEVVHMARKSIRLNNLEDRFQIINCDINDIFPKKILEKNKYDVVVTNPPYKEAGTGIINESSKKLISRHEITATLADFIKVAAGLLKHKGEFYIVHKPERIVDIITIMRENKIEPKELRIVYPRKEKDASLILVKGVKGGNKFTTIDRSLIIYEEDGSYTNDIKEIYND